MDQVGLLGDALAQQQRLGGEFLPARLGLLQLALGLGLGGGERVARGRDGALFRGQRRGLLARRLQGFVLPRALAAEFAQRVGQLRQVLLLAREFGALLRELAFQLGPGGAQVAAARFHQRERLGLRRDLRLGQLLLVLARPLLLHVEDGGGREFRRGLRGGRPARGGAARHPLVPRARPADEEQQGADQEIHDDD